MSNLEWVELVLPPAEGDLPQIIGPKLRWKGKALDIPMVKGPVTLEMGWDQFPVLVLRIPVLVVLEAEE